MLEIIAIILLCKFNSKHAVERGRKPGLFIFYTILFWLLGEFVGGIIGGIFGLEMTTYIIALGLGILGGACSYFLAKNCKPGNYVPALKEKKSPVDSCQTPKFCENCGTEIVEGSLFCYNCGAKVPDEMPKTTPQTLVAEVFKTQNAFSKAPYLLGFSAAILWSFIFGLHFIPKLPLVYSYASSILLTYTMLASAAFLFWKKGITHNVSAILFTIFFAVTNVMNPILNLMNQKYINRFVLFDNLIFSQYKIWTLKTLVILTVAVGLSFLLRFLSKNREKKQEPIFALVFSGAVFLTRFLLEIKNLVQVFVSGSPKYVLSMLESQFSVLAALLLVLFTLIFMEKIPNKGSKNNVWGILWAVVCMVAFDTVCVLGLVEHYLMTSYNFVMGIAMIVAFIFLLARRKFAFSLISVLPLLNVLVQLSWAINTIIQARVSVLSCLMALFGAGANIFITWFLFIKEKKN